MANTLEVTFQGSFDSDGSNTLIIDFVSGPVSFGSSSGLWLIPNAKLATGSTLLYTGGGTIDTAVLSHGILTVTFSTPPSLGQQSYTGFLRF